MSKKIVQANWTQDNKSTSAAESPENTENQERDDGARTIQLLGIDFGALAMDEVPSPIGARLVGSHSPMRCSA
jgi:hypothetical protein